MSELYERKEAGDLPDESMVISSHWLAESDRTAIHHSDVLLTSAECSTDGEMRGGVLTLCRKLHHLFVKHDPATTRPTQRCCRRATRAR